MNFEPFGDRVLVRRKDAEEMSPGGIVLPEVTKEKPQEGTVLAAGPAVQMAKAGDTVLFSKWSGTDVKIAAESFLLLREEELFGRLS